MTGEKMQMTALKPVARSRRAASDIADGSFDESLFAADLGMVDRGRGPADYLDPVDLLREDLPDREPRSRFSVS